MDIKEILQHGEEFRYQMLDRMRVDCEYYLGNGGRHTKYLWGDNEVDHISHMKALWKSFPEDKKPEWLPYEKIQEYEASMCPSAVLVERNYKGDLERFALTPDEFLAEYGIAIGQAHEAGREWDGATLQPMVHISYVNAAVGDEEWERFFTDMEYGLSQGDIEAGNIAYVREDLMQSLRQYMPDKQPSLDAQIKNAVKIGEMAVSENCERPGVRDQGPGVRE